MAWLIIIFGSAAIVSSVVAWGISDGPVEGQSGLASRAGPWLIRGAAFTFTFLTTATIAYVVSLIILVVFGESLIDGPHD